MPIARLVLAGLAGLLAALIVADMFVMHHPAFGIDGTPGFAAIFGLVASAAAIALAFGWGQIARRRETAAEEEGRDG
ncbi:hypothetical protein SAMN02745157_0597 [Kaistia soli DSM 19436]|uniref:Uncharacterized protein n=1 Tax=Kaistia soli DSM 19436 TaxID=1122133 RepID=A0A1M4V392_9HYPH|nr:hypothetical protein [Kaistia soli]SHE63357.1 hypothetical protein SAMN02745157_0597 [Kaistia soli DSM 19436]